jgi:hypothetical protein
MLLSIASGDVVAKSENNLIRFRAGDYSFGLASRKLGN